MCGRILNRHKWKYLNVSARPYINRERICEKCGRREQEDFKFGLMGGIGNSITDDHWKVVCDSEK